MGDTVLRKYEGVIIFDPELDEASLRREIEQLEGMITSRGGSIDETALWGRQQLNYPIRKRNFGNYVVVRFSGPAGLVNELERQLRIADAVLRALVVKADESVCEALPKTAGGGREEQGPDRAFSENEASF